MANSIPFAGSMSPMRKEAKLKLETAIQAAIPDLSHLEQVEESSNLKNDWFGSAALRGQDVVIAATMSRKASAERLQGSLARLALELKAATTGKKIILPIVVDEKVGRTVVEKIEDFATRCLPNVSFGVFGASCGVLNVPSLNLRNVKEEENQFARSQAPKRRRSRLFSDLDRWLLKVFLFEELRLSLQVMDPPSSWPPKDVKALSSFTALAYESARVFVDSYAERGFLVRHPGPIRLLHVRQLLEAWLEDERSWTHEQVFAKSLYGGTRSLSDFRDPAIISVVGGFEAARVHGLKHASSPAPPLIHLDIELKVAMDKWDLVQCEEHDADVLLRRPAHPRSVFSSSTESPEGLRVVDPWQVALDVVSMRPRGAEQAAHVLDHIVAEMSQ